MFSTPFQDGVSARLKNFCVRMELETNTFTQKLRGTNLKARLLEVRHMTRPKFDFTLTYHFTPFRNQHLQTGVASPSKLNRFICN